MTRRTILPPPPESPAPLPALRPYEPDSASWRAVETMSEETVRPAKRGESS